MGAPSNQILISRSPCHPSGLTLPGAEKPEGSFGAVGSEGRRGADFLEPVPMGPKGGTSMVSMEGVVQTGALSSFPKHCVGGSRCLNLSSFTFRLVSIPKRSQALELFCVLGLDPPLTQRFLTQHHHPIIQRSQIPLVSMFCRPSQLFQPLC